MKTIINKIKSVFTADYSDLSKFDEAELTAESSAVIKDIIQSMQNPQDDSQTKIFLLAPPEELILDIEPTVSEVSIKQDDHQFKNIDLEIDIVNPQVEEVHLSLKEKLYSAVHTSVEVSRESPKSGKRIISNSTISVPQYEEESPLRKRHENGFKEELK
jgi:hypothetical protein